MIRVLLLLLLLPIFTLAQKQAVLSLTTDNYPTETSWCLFADSLYGDTIASIDTGDLILDGGDSATTAREYIVNALTSSTSPARTYIIDPGTSV